MLRNVLRTPAVASSSRLPIRCNSTNTPDLPPTSTFIANTPPRAVRNPFASGRNPSWNSLALVEQSEQVGGLMVRDGQGRPIPKPRTSVNEWWKTISAKRDNYSAGDQYLGRTINIPRGADFQKAYRQLNGIMRDANIKKDKLRQEFYEKPSEKRVRLASERHRRRFAQMVSIAIPAEGLQVTPSTVSLRRGSSLANRNNCRFGRRSRW